jgi:hypothetical protein
MTVKIDNTEPNLFPVIEKIDARDSGRDAEVILATKIEGQLTFVTVKLSYRQAGDLWAQLEPFRHSKHSAWPRRPGSFSKST